MVAYWVDRSPCIQEIGVWSQIVTDQVVTNAAPYGLQQVLVSGVFKDHILNIFPVSQ